jgi:hypothetical protein
MNQIRDMVADMLDGQDLNGPEAQQLSEKLRDQLRQASAEGLTPDQAAARAEDFASMYMMNLHRSYVRKATRLGTFADAERTPADDIFSPDGAVIPAARDANGDLIWVDKMRATSRLTSARIAGVSIVSIEWSQHVSSSPRHLHHFRHTCQSDHSSGEGCTKFAARHRYSGPPDRRGHQR